MPLIEYVPKRFTEAHERVIEQANTIIASYTQKLTLRQLYYRFVAFGFIPNKQTEYKRLGDIVKHARLAGRIDWDAVEDQQNEERKLLRAASHRWDELVEILEEDDDDEI